MEIIICDDDHKTLDFYKREIRKKFPGNAFDLNIQGVTSEESFFFAMGEDTNNVDLVFMDIHLGNGQNGIDVAKRLRGKGFVNDIVFLTRDETQVFDAFDVEPMQYFVKTNISDMKFKDTLAKAWDRAKNRKEEIIAFSCAGETRNISVSDIVYFEVVQRIITVYYKEEKFEFYSPIGKIENLLNSKGFVRIHRAFLINTKHITRSEANEVHLSNGVVVPIGRTYKKHIKERLHEVSNLG